MRFYRIEIEGGPIFTSLANGVNDPGALDIEFDINVTDRASNRANHVKIRGIDPKLISRNVNFNGKNLKMWAGYSKGLPIANKQIPHQGLILDGEIWPCFGNWIYNELSLEFFVINTQDEGLGGPTKPLNIVHNMQSGQPLAEAMRNTLKTAFPLANIIINISDNLKLNYPDYGMYQSLEQYQNYIKALSHSILGNNPKYKGVSVTTDGKNIYAYDQTKPGKPINIEFIDLVGQPTWIDAQLIQVTTLLRADVNVPNGNEIILPKTLATQTFEGAKGLRNNLLDFQGSWTVQNVRHVGQFRNPSFEAWVTIINATGGDITASSEATPNQSGEQIFNAPNQGTPSLGGAFGSGTQGPGSSPNPGENQGTPSLGGEFGAPTNQSGKHIWVTRG